MLIGVLPPCLGDPILGSGQIEPSAASAADLDEVLGLFNRELGDPLYSMASLRAVLDDPTATLLVARLDGQVAGAALGRLLVPGDLDYYLRFGDAAERAFEAGTVGSLEALAVAPTARHRGRGRALVDAVAAWLFGAGSASIVAVGWDSGRPDSSLPLLRAMGYAESTRVDRFYEEESLQAGWGCPVCGMPCTCGAVLFLRARPGAWDQPTG
jgi:GNAT superfamily N-acetyltransferase